MFKDNPVLDQFKDNPVLAVYFKKMLEIFSANRANENPTEAPIDYSTFKVAELKAFAKSRGFKGYTKLKKSELIDLLNENQ